LFFGPLLFLLRNTGTEAMYWPLLVRGLGTGIFVCAAYLDLTLGGLNGKDVGQASPVSPI
jgi:hypothetical protein